ncbi:unnamed protein product [Miscanthus lutarioriparius]|uniref:Uncharacterized protein n=1 Tax=Miscanthus lutarioriparius TaxID=422564 RepID=A0A811MI99_9POAL|nr:unnamed protein product [Miscanthus lutarioriparius]
MARSAGAAGAGGGSGEAPRSPLGSFGGGRQQRRRLQARGPLSPLAPRCTPQSVAARWSVVAAATAGNGAAASGGFDYDLVIIGAGVGGHGGCPPRSQEVIKYRY